MHKNYDFGLRSFIDCLLDVFDFDYFAEFISLIEENEENKEMPDEEFYSKILLFLDKLELSESSLKKEQLIHAQAVSRSYGDGKFSLKNVSLDVFSGEVIGLVGENGNGKTTFLRILAKELGFDSGVIQYKNTSKNSYDIRTELVFIPQRTPTWYGNLYDNLKFTAANYGFKGAQNQLYVI